MVLIKLNLNNSIIQTLRFGLRINQYHKSGNFRCQNIFIVVRSNENKFCTKFLYNEQFKQRNSSYKEWTNLRIITVQNISAFAVVLKHCQLSFIKQHLSYRTHRDPMHLCTHGLLNTTVFFEYTSAILVVRFAWQTYFSLAQT